MNNPPDNSWFQEVYERNRGLIFCRCFWFMQNKQDAEDMTQETFLRAFAIPSFPSKPPDHQKYWLLRTANHRCLDKIGRPFKSVSANEDGVLDKLIDTNPSPEALAVHEEFRGKLGVLSPEERRAAMLWAYGHTFEEIGEILGCSTATAFNHYRNAIAKLRRLY